MENSSQSLSVYCKNRCSCSRTEKSRKLRCTGSTLGLMKLHKRWKITCKLCILPCLPIEAKQFWFGVLAYALVYVLVYVLMMLVYVHMCMDVNTTMSCVINLHYAVCCYDVMLLCFYVGFLFNRVIIDNTASS